MNKYHQELLVEIKKYRSECKWKNINKYLGTPNYVYGLKAGDYGKILKYWKSAHSEMTKTEFFELLDSLNKNGKSVEEKIFVGSFLGKYPEFRKVVELKYLYSWFGNVVGWVEIDTLCCFEGEEVLSRWDEWKKLLEDFSCDSNISRRRASLVLLTRPVRWTEDERLSDLAFANIELLKSEKEILITKAVSWLMRSLIKYHRGELEDYIKKNEDSLPKIALRETKRKLLTGRK